MLEPPLVGNVRRGSSCPPASHTCERNVDVHPNTLSDLRGTGVEEMREFTHHTTDVQISSSGDLLTIPREIRVEEFERSPVCSLMQPKDTHTKSMHHSNSESNVYTSEARPLTVSCVHLPPPAGHAGDVDRMIGFCMALGRVKQKNGYAWARDLRQDIIQLITTYHPDVLVTMMPLEELHEVGAEDLPQLAQTEGLEWLHFGIVDKFVPMQGFASFMKMAERLATKLRAGQRIVIHCNGGKGRSALMTAAAVYAYTQNTEGVPSMSITDVIAKVRSGSASGALRNPLQVAYLHACQYDPGSLTPTIRRWLQS